MAYTWNPLDKSAAITLSNGNLTAASNLDNYKGVRATQYKSSGKYYWEITTTVVAEGSASEVGVGTSAVSLSNIIGYSATGWSWAANGFYYHNNGSTWAGSALTDGAIICIALDLDNGKLWFGKNGTWNNSGNPETGTNPTFTGLSGNIYPMLQQRGGSEWTANFGATAFAYTVPAGFTGIGSIEGSTTESATTSDTMEALHLVDAVSESATTTDTMDALHLVDSIPETAEVTDLMGRSIETERSTTESATASDLMESLHLVDSITESAEATDTFGNERTAYGPTVESAEVTDLMDALHLVDDTTESAVALGLMESAELIRKRIRFPNLQGKHLSLKFESSTDGSFALYYLRHKMFKTRELTSDQKHPNTQGSHIGIKLSNSGSDAFTLMYVSEKMQLVTT
jgi:hypothetical protein